MKIINTNIVSSLISLLVILSYVSSIFAVGSVLYLLSNAAIVLCTFFFFYIVILNKKNIDYKTITLILLIVVLIIITQRIESTSLLCLVCLNYVYDTDKNKDYIKCYFYTSVVCFGIIFLANKAFGFNALYDGNIWRNTLDGFSGAIYRYALGFTHPNAASIKWFSIVISGLAFSFSKGKKTFFKYLIIFLISSIYILSETQTRSVMLVLSFCLLGLLIDTVFKRSNNLIKFKWLIKYFPILFLILSLVMVLLSSNVVFSNFLSGRPQFYYMYINNYGFSLFGNDFLDKHALIDNSYLHIMLTKGTLTYVLYAIINATYFFDVKKIQTNYTVLLMSLFIVAMFETILFKFEIAILILILIKSANEESYTLKDSVEESRI